MTCSACGSEVPDAARFCPSCGSAVVLGSTPTEATEANPRPPGSPGVSPSRRVRAQSQPSQYVTRVWQREQGLPQNSVNAMVQDHRGYLWIGTFVGLARFDGQRFTVFDSADTPGFGSDHIFSLYESYSGVLWIGTVGGGLIRLDDGVASKYTERDGLPSGFISSIREDAKGNVWINTSRGVARFVGTELEAYPTHRGKALREFFLQARYVLAITQTCNSDL